MGMSSLFPSLATGQGHISPMAQFAKRLASKGVATTLVLTHFISRTSVVDAHPAVTEAISDGHNEGGFASATSVGKYLEKQATAASASLASLIEARASSSSAADRPFTCVVYNSYESWVLPEARRMGLPAVPFATQSCAVSAVYYHFSQGRFAVPPPRAKDDSGGGCAARSNAFEGLPEMERSEFPLFVFDHGPLPMIAKLALEQLAHEGKDDLVLFNSFEDLESEVSEESEDPVYSYKCPCVATGVIPSLETSFQHIS